MRYELAEKIFNHLYDKIDGYKISNLARNKIGAENKVLIYGEITLKTLHDILKTLPLKTQHQTFYDLGSGTGKAIFGTYLLSNFKNVIGVELLDELHQSSFNLLKYFKKNISPLLLPNWQQTNINFLQADMLQHDFSDGDVLYLHSTCFSKKMLAELENKFAGLKPNSLIITVSTKLFAPFLKHIYQQKYRMGWGDATVYIYKKT